MALFDWNELYVEARDGKLHVWGRDEQLTEENCRIISCSLYNDGGTAVMISDQNVTVSGVIVLHMLEDAPIKEPV